MTKTGEDPKGGFDSVTVDEGRRGASKRVTARGEKPKCRKKVKYNLNKGLEKERRKTLKSEDEDVQTKKRQGEQSHVLLQRLFCWCLRLQT